MQLGRTLPAFVLPPNVPGFQKSIGVVSDFTRGEMFTFEQACTAMDIHPK